MLKKVYMNRPITRGFTIVELLIVIVVIAIIVAITIVAYNGIQDRARMASAQSFASSIVRRDLGDAVGYWTFDECSGSSAKDSSGSGSGVAYAITGTATWSNDTPNSKGCSLSFNGSTSITTDIALSNNYYLKAAWFKSTSSSAAMNIISSTTSNNSNSALFLWSGKLSGGHNGLWSQVIDNQMLNDGKWHYGAIEYTKNTTDSNGTLKLYVDGRQVSTDASVPPMNDISQTMAIGRFGSGNQFNGLIDNPMIVVK